MKSILPYCHVQNPSGYHFPTAGKCYSYYTSPIPRLKAENKQLHTFIYYRHYTSYIRIQYKLLYGIAEKRTQKERNMINSHLQIRRGTKYTLRSMGSVTQVKPT